MPKNDPEDWRTRLRARLLRDLERKSNDEQVPLPLPSTPEEQAQLRRECAEEAYALAREYAGTVRHGRWDCALCTKAIHDYECIAGLAVVPRPPGGPL